MKSLIALNRFSLTSRQVIVTDDLVAPGFVNILIVARDPSFPMSNPLRGAISNGFWNFSDVYGTVCNGTSSDPNTPGSPVDLNCYVRKSNYVVQCLLAASMTCKFTC